MDYISQGTPSAFSPTGSKGVGARYTLGAYHTHDTVTGDWGLRNSKSRNINNGALLDSSPGPPIIVGLKEAGAVGTTTIRRGKTSTGKIILREKTEEEL